jgi:hypothetical protein
MGKNAKSMEHRAKKTVRRKARERNGIRIIENRANIKYQNANIKFGGS